MLNATVPGAEALSKALVGVPRATVHIRGLAPGRLP
jgi:hypothetical protein